MHKPVHLDSQRMKIFFFQFNEMIEFINVLVGDAIEKIPLLRTFFMSRDQVL